MNPDTNRTEKLAWKQKIKPGQRLPAGEKIYRNEQAREMED
jgi:hypothetical protein